MQMPNFVVQMTNRYTTRDANASFRVAMTSGRVCKREWYPVPNLTNRQSRAARPRLANAWIVSFYIRRDTEYHTHDMVINVSSEPQFFVIMLLVYILPSTKIVLRAVGMVPASTPTTLDSDANTSFC